MSAVKELIKISRYAGMRVDYTQGGGGNTSVKDGDEMVIKASGFKLKDITETNAYVPIAYNKMIEFLDSVDYSRNVDYEKLNGEVTKSSIIRRKDLPELRPSVEVGFHAVLKKIVCHTHSIYANLLTCSVKGEKIAKEIFTGCDFKYIFMPYIDPGFKLSLEMQKRVKMATSYPEVIFMKNHGLVVSGDSEERVEQVNTMVNELIRQYYGITENYETVSLKKLADNRYLSETSFISDFLKNNTIDCKFFDSYPLYPDQLVYLNNLIRNTPEKLQISGGKLCYNTSANEAQTLEEALFAYLFVLETILKRGDEVSLMDKSDVDFINNWEAEKYRRSLSQKS